MFLIDRRYLRYFDWLSFLLVIVLSSLGVLLVFSATYRPEHMFSLFFKKQLFGVISGLCIYITCCIIDYRTLQRWGYFFYFGIIVLLLFTLVKGSIGMGGQRWISYSGIRFQPSELTKLFFPAFFSYYLYTEKDIDYSFKTFVPILAVVGCSVLLIRKQPDLGTALILLFASAVMMWLAGIGKKFFMWSFVLFLVTAPLTWACLKPYQKKRIAVFLGEGDSRKERYQIEQSQIAIGSGGFTGKGFLKGTQNKFQFLPESRTDFIFSVMAEEWGFLGALTVIFLYSLLFLRLFYVTTTIKNFYAQLLATGLVIHCVVSMIVNIGMVTGLLPVVGIPLPLLSYGVSNLWITFASLGWFNSIASRRFDML